MPTSPLFWVLVVIGVVGLAAVAWWLLRGYKRGGWGPTKVKVKTPFAEAEFEPGQEENKSPAAKPARPAGVHFGRDSDFTGATIKGITGRDRISGAATQPKGGQTPGVDFGERGKFREAQIEDVTGRDRIEK